MRQINCYIPIKLCITGRLSDTQLDQLGEKLMRALVARISFAQRTIASHSAGRLQSGKAEIVRAEYNPSHEDVMSTYRVPSYRGEGKAQSISLQRQPLGLRIVKISDIEAKIDQILKKPAGMGLEYCRQAFSRSPADAKAMLEHTHFRDDDERLTFAACYFRRTLGIDDPNELFYTVLKYEMQVQSQTADLLVHTPPTEAESQRLRELTQQRQAELARREAERKRLEAERARRTPEDISACPSPKADGPYANQGIALPYDKLVPEPNPREGFDEEEVKRTLKDPRRFEQLYYDATTGTGKAAWLVCQFEMHVQIDAREAAKGFDITTGRGFIHAFLGTGGYSFANYGLSSQTASGRRMFKVFTEVFSAAVWDVQLSNEVLGHLAALWGAGKLTESVLADAARTGTVAGRVPLPTTPPEVKTPAPPPAPTTPPARVSGGAVPAPPTLKPPVVAEPPPQGPTELAASGTQVTVTPEARAAKKAASKVEKQGSQILDPERRSKATASKEELEKELKDRPADITRREREIAEFQKQLEKLGTRKTPEALKNDKDYRNLPRLGGTEHEIDNRLEALKDLEQNLAKANRLSPEVAEFINWEKQKLSLQKEIQGSKEAIVVDEQRLKDIRDVKMSVAEDELRKASQSIKKLVRKSGPNYRAKEKINYDEVIGESRWESRKAARRAEGKKQPLRLATDHLFSLDAIANLAELDEFLKIYAGAPEPLKARMLEDLSALGDIPGNLKRMDYDANNLKSNRSWHNVTYDEWKEYGYKASDVDSMRQAEDASLKAIKEAIAELTKKYRAAKTP